MILYHIAVLSQARPGRPDQVASSDGPALLGMSVHADHEAQGVSHDRRKRSRRGRSTGSESHLRAARNWSKPERRRIPRVVSVSRPTRHLWICTSLCGLW